MSQWKALHYLNFPHVCSKDKCWQVYKGNGLEEKNLKSTINKEYVKYIIIKNWIIG